jgi:hypothetical protein
MGPSTCLRSMARRRASRRVEYYPTNVRRAYRPRLRISTRYSRPASCTTRCPTASPQQLHAETVVQHFFRSLLGTRRKTSIFSPTPRHLIKTYAARRKNDISNPFSPTNSSTPYHRTGSRLDRHLASVYINGSGKGTSTPRTPLRLSSSTTTAVPLGMSAINVFAR